MDAWAGCYPTDDRRASRRSPDGPRLAVMSGTPRAEWRAAAAAVSTPPALRASVRQLMILRSVAVVGQTGAIASASYLGVALPLAPMAVVVGALVAVNALTWLRLRTAREASHADIAAHLAFDLAALTTLLFFSGGATNPFSLLFVLHAVLLALLLPPGTAALGTAAAIACYVVLIRVHEPLQMVDGASLPVGLRLIGLEASFALTAGFTAWFVARITAALRDHDRRLSEAVQRALRDDAVLRVGALAAGAAHELSAPLATMAVIAADIQGNSHCASLAADVSKLRAQIDVCRETIANLMAAAGHAQPAGGGAESVDRFLESIADACRATRPGARIRTDWRAADTAPRIFGDHGLRQALLALLNNAVDASPDDVRFVASLAPDTLRIAIVDHGPGLAADDLEKVGRAFFTTKPRGKGAGLGLVVASRAIERLGGTLRFEKRSEGGTRAEVALPLGGLRVEAG
jgi:two-component system sensor histidine kinase RegB